MTVDNDTKYSGLEQAQAYVVPSYQFMLSRLEAVDSRLQTVVAFVATVTLAVPAMSRALQPAISFESAWFVSAVVLALATIALGSAVRLSGALSLVNPATVYAQWLHLSQWEFQRHALYYAGQHFEANGALVNRKARGVFVMTSLFLLELICLFVWIARA